MMNFNRIRCLMKRIRFTSSRQYIFNIIGSLIIYFLVCYLTRDGVLETFSATKCCIFGYSLASIWIGLFNSIGTWNRDKVFVLDDFANYKYTVLEYVISMLCTQLVLCVIQAIIGTAVFVRMFDISKNGIVFDFMYVDFFITTLLVIIAGMTMGLCIGSVLINMDMALGVVPLILITQLLMSQGIFQLPEKIEFLSDVILAKYALSTLGSLLDMNTYPMELKLMYPAIEQVESPLFDATLNFVTGNWVCIGVLIVIPIVIMSFVLKYESKKVNR